MLIEYNAAVKIIREIAMYRYEMIFKMYDILIHRKKGVEQSL